MLIIKIFLASSVVEFEQDRRDLREHVRDLSEEYRSRGVCFELIMCENESQAVSAQGRKQDEYNELIRQSDYVYFLVGRHAGTYTQEEFDVAYDCLRENKKQHDTECPRIFTYFLELPSGEERDDSANEFMEYIDEHVQHYHSTFAHLDTIKLAITMELMHNQNIGGSIALRDGRVVINGHESFSLENVPAYQSNSALQACKRELAEVSEEFYRLRMAAIDHPEDDELFDKYSDANIKKRKLEKEIREIEDAIQKQLAFVTDKSRAGAVLNWREKTALELIQKGRTEEANRILNDPTWEKDIDLGNATGEAIRTEVASYISGKRLLIANLRSLGVTKDMESQILAWYARLSELVETWLVSWEVLIEHAEFLSEQNHFAQALEVAKRCEQHAKLRPFSDELLVRVYHVLGESLQDLHDCHESVPWLLKERDVLQRLVKRYPIDYEPQLVAALCSLATDFNIMRAFSKRDAHIAEAAHLAERLYQQDQRAYADLLTSVRNRQAVYANGANRLEDAEAHHKQVIAIREELVRLDAWKYERSLSVSYNNYACLLRKMGRFDEAESFYVMCLDIRRRRAARNPAAYEHAVALAQTNYAMLLRYIGRLDESEQALEDALDIRSRLARIDPAAFETGLSITMRELAITLITQGEKDRLQKAKNLLENATTLVERLAEREPEGSSILLAELMHAKALLCEREAETEQADACYAEALRLMEGDVLAMSEDLRYWTARMDYANYLARSQRNDEAREHYKSALAFMQTLAEKNPSAPAFRSRVAWLQDVLTNGCM